ncbi:MAG: alanine dehydrogenase [Rickettsiales bacterium]|nr:alanine dehydrogenase [Rickettsiales bacterium]|tara:strand:+ start:20 stop:1138 length:1119 start_codon:yes stop_codon:yes gene_type:complete
MKVGIPKEIKNHEYRVGLAPAGVRELVANGHEVFVETMAGHGIGMSDEKYSQAGATILKTAEEIFETAEMIVKVKEPQEVECKRLREGQILFTYLHLAPDPKQTELLVKSGAVAIAYETVTDERGGLPLLAPMSEIAGRMSIQAGAHCLEKATGGRGVLLSGVPGVTPGKVTIIGGGVSGMNAAQMAIGMGADVTVLERSIPRMRELDAIFNGRVKTRYSNVDNIENEIIHADLVIGAVLVPGAAAPKLIAKDTLARMKHGSVIVDIAIDQGGCTETSKPTTHQEPTFVVNNVVHYCVANMPGAVARTSTLALNNATLPFVLKLAGLGWKEALKQDVHLKEGLNVCLGDVTYKAVAETLGYDYVEPDKHLNA